MSTPTDTELLDHLEAQGTPGMGWVARQSIHGRGYRLHQTTAAIGTPLLDFSDVTVQPTAREALRAAIQGGTDAPAEPT